MQNSNYIKRLVTDTGPLLVHSASLYENGRLLKYAVTSLKIAEIDAIGFAKMIDRLFSTVREILVTPYVLAELCNLVQIRLRLRENELSRFINSYSEFLLKLKEWHCEKDELIAFKRSLKLCFTDSSVALASKREGIPLVTVDRKLVGWCKSQGIEAMHIYHKYLVSK